MSDDFKFDEHIDVEFQTKPSFSARDNLLAELYRQKYESLNKKNRSIAPDEKQNLNMIFDKAKEKIKQEIISCDNSPDNSVVYTAMANFKKRKV